MTYLQHQHKNPLLLIALIVFIGAVYFLLSKFIIYELAVFIPGFIIPAIFFKIIKRQNLSFITLKKFTIGISAYLMIFAILLFYIYLKPEFFTTYKISEFNDFCYYGFLTFLNVAPVDFFTKRVIQYECSKIFNRSIGILAGLNSWIVVHILELKYLSALMGCTGALWFIIFTGILTSLVYSKNNEVYGLIFGHVLINILVVIFANQLI